MIAIPIVLLALAALIVTVLLLPFSAKITFDTDSDLTVRFGVGFVRADVTELLLGDGTPDDEKPVNYKKQHFDGAHFGSFKNEPDKKVRKKQQNANRKLTQTRKSREATVTEKLRILLRLLGETLVSLSHYATLEIKKCTLVAALPEADQTAYLYAAMSAAAAGLMKLGEVYDRFIADKSAFDIRPDYTAGKPDADLDVRLGMRGYQIIQFILEAGERTLSI